MEDNGTENPAPRIQKGKDKYLLHIVLFLLAVLTTMMAGAELATARSWGGGLEWMDLKYGALYSFTFLLFLTCHEFGHYFMAVYHKVKCSLPYYIPIFFPGGIAFNIGSFGAVIRLRQIPKTTRQYFDIGVAGPLAGFVISLFLLIYGFATLPPMEESVYEIHPEYKTEFQQFPTQDELVATQGMVINVGTNLLFEILKNTIPADPSQVPPPFEMMHFPLLFVGFLTLFFTALNLLPIGQLDGGHVIYGLMGRKRAGVIARMAVGSLLLMGGTGIVKYVAFDPRFYPSMSWYIAWNIFAIIAYPLFLYYIYSRLMPKAGQKRNILLVALTLIVQAGLNLIFPEISTNPLWLIYAVAAVRLIGVDHPPAQREIPLDFKRKVVGWIAIIIFILSFTPTPLSMAF